jgi:hypothetical protein
MLEFLAEEQGRGEELRSGAWPKGSARRGRSGLKPGAKRGKARAAKTKPD